jgi:hypothetical protein
MAAPSALEFILGHYQGRRALKNRRLPLASIVRAFSALLEWCDLKGLFAQKKTVQYNLQATQYIGK